MMFDLFVVDYVRYSPAPRRKSMRENLGKIIRRGI